MKNHPLIKKLRLIHKPLAYGLIAISTIAWLMVFVVPFFDLSTVDMALWITVLFIIGEVAFYIAILLLGKTVWEKIKNKLFTLLPDEVSQKFMKTASNETTDNKDSNKI